MKSSTSVIDPIPPIYLNLDLVLFTLFKKNETLLCSDVVPIILKNAAMTPLPKKHNMILDNVNNFFPIS